MTLVKDHSDFKVKCLTFGLYTQESDSGPLIPVCTQGFSDTESMLIQRHDVELTLSRCCFCTMVLFGRVTEINLIFLFSFFCLTCVYLFQTAPYVMSTTCSYEVENCCGRFDTLLHSLSLVIFPCKTPLNNKYSGPSL